MFLTPLQQTLRVCTDLQELRRKYLTPRSGSFPLTQFKISASAQEAVAHTFLVEGASTRKLLTHQFQDQCSGAPVPDDRHFTILLAHEKPKRTHSAETHAPIDRDRVAIVDTTLAELDWAAAFKTDLRTIAQHMRTTANEIFLDAVYLPWHFADHESVVWHGGVCFRRCDHETS